MKVAGEQTITIATGIDLTNQTDRGITFERERDGDTKTFDNTRVVVDGGATLGNLKIDLAVTDFQAGDAGAWRASGFVVVSGKRYPLETAVLTVEEEYE